MMKGVFQHSLLLQIYPGLANSKLLKILIKRSVCVCLFVFKVYAINGAGAGPKIQLKITMDIKGMFHKLPFS